MKIYLLLITIGFFFSGCDNREREKKLEEKETALNQKEQELILKETTLKVKEEDLLKREQRLDSTKIDSISVYNPVLVGRWTAQMVCTETTCPGSAVGDSKTETWDIQYINNKVIAKAQSGEQLVRVYTGIYTGNTLELVENNESTGTQPATKMVVQLRIVNPRSMEGQREIIREGNCKILYSLQLTKQ